MAGRDSLTCTPRQLQMLQQPAGYTHQGVLLHRVLVDLDMPQCDTKAGKH